MICEYHEYIGWFIALLAMILAIVFAKANEKLQNEQKKNEDIIWRQQLELMRRDHGGGEN